MSDKDQPVFLSARQVAERYGLTVRWVYGCRTLPRRKAGKFLVFRLDELEEFEKSWQKATSSYRTYQTKRELGTASHNILESWVNPPIKKDSKFKLLMDME